MRINFATKHFILVDGHKILQLKKRRWNLGDHNTSWHGSRKLH